MKTATKKGKIFNFICVALMVVLFVLQLTPYWESGADTASISGYVWTCTEHDELTSYFEAETGADFDVNQIVLATVLVVLGCGAGVILGVMKPNSIWVSILQVATGVVTIVAYLTKPVLKLGSLWGLHFGLGVVILVVAILAFYFNLKARKE